MGFNIGSVLSGLGIPKLDLGSIGKDILSEGKKLLGEVVKDSFTLSNQPGGQTFASKMNLDIGGSNVSLPNPIGALANKLLGGVDSELNKFGLNIDFKKVAQELFHLPTEKGGSVTIPSAAGRSSSGSLPPSPAAAVASTHFAAVTSGPMGLGGGGSGSTGSTGSTNSNAFSSGTITDMTSPAESLFNTAQDEMKNAGTDPQKLQQATTDMQRATEAFSMISDMLRAAHDTRMTMINNMAQ